MSSKFKIGDRVVIVDSVKPILIGEIGEVVSIEDRVDSIGVQLDYKFKPHMWGKNEYGLYRSFTSNKLKLIKNTEMKLLDDPEYEGMFI